MSSRIYFERAILLDKKSFKEFGVFRFKTENIPQISRPGQFVMLKLNLHPYPLLARPFSIFHAEERILSLFIKKVGITTNGIFNLHAGESVFIYGPLGNGFPEEFGDKVVLIGGGSGIAPLNFYAKRYGFKRFLAGFNTRIDDVFSLLPKNVEIYTEDGSYGRKGLPTDYVEDIGDFIFACGPLPMLQALKKKMVNKMEKIYVSLESIMGCGTGLCAGCGVKKSGEEGYFRVCLDGPVFPFSRIEI